MMPARSMYILRRLVTGACFRYLVSVLGPSLDSPDEMLAEQTIFFLPIRRGLGLA